jgi:hypothetical protein
MTSPRSRISGSTSAQAEREKCVSLPFMAGGGFFLKEFRKDLLYLIVRPRNAGTFPAGCSYDCMKGHGSILRRLEKNHAVPGMGRNTGDTITFPVYCICPLEDAA